jgi:hypothetical protein
VAPAMPYVKVPKPTRNVLVSHTNVEYFFMMYLLDS